MIAQIKILTLAHHPEFFRTIMTVTTFKSVEMSESNGRLSVEDAQQCEGGEVGGAALLKVSRTGAS
jgi:hypothetical protein